MNVIQGIGTPRIITNGTYLVSEFATVNLKTVTLTTGTLDDDCLNRWAVGRDANGDFVSGKIIAYNSSLKSITVDAWNSEMGTVPSVGGRITIAGRVIDLPHPQLMLEEFSLDSDRNKKFNGDMGINKKGFYYKASLNYSLMKKEVLESLEEVLNDTGQWFYLYPRKDNIIIWYKVRLDDEFKFGQRLRKHRDLSIKLIGTERLDRINIIGEYGYGEYWGYWN